MTVFTPENTDNLQARWRADYTRFYVDALGMREDFIWEGMHKIANSVRDNQKTCVYSGHSLSKDYGCARLALSFLLANGPKCTVVVTGPANNQVENVFCREVGDAYNNAIIPLGGSLTTTKLEFDKKWFLLGFTTDVDTVTGEATRFQGFHNEYVLVIFTEAAGIMPQIWKAAQSLIVGPNHRWLVYGNATSSVGDFALCDQDPEWHKIHLSVLDSPNYKAGREVIPGISGREFVETMKRKYGENSDEFAVRVKGEISKKGVQGSYYGDTLAWMRQNERIGEVPYNPAYLVHTVCDPGFTTAWWFFQVMRTGTPRIIRYYEDQGRDFDYYSRWLKSYKELYGYNYGKHFAPVDADNNQYKLAYGDGLVELARKSGLNLTVLPFEKSVQLGIERTQIFLKSCLIDEEGCKVGLDRLKAYHQKINKRMSSETQTVFGLGPEKDGNDHGADSMRYLSMAADKVDLEDNAPPVQRKSSYVSLGVG